MPRFQSPRLMLAVSLALALVACQAAGDGSPDAVAHDEQEAAAIAAAGEPASPWDAAASRGVAFRAVGNEPGWYVEVDGGATPALHATLDYGDRKIEVPHATVLEGDAFGYRGTATDGSLVVMRIRREPCSDGMSDRAYDTSVALDVGEATYRGCGRFLGK